MVPEIASPMIKNLGDNKDRRTTLIKPIMEQDEESEKGQNELKSSGLGFNDSS